MIRVKHTNTDNIPEKKSAEGRKSVQVKAISAVRDDRKEKCDLHRNLSEEKVLWFEVQTELETGCLEHSTTNSELWLEERTAECLL